MTAQERSRAPTPPTALECPLGDGSSCEAGRLCGAERSIAIARNCSKDRGAATLLAVAVIGLIVGATTGALLLVSAVDASHRARLAADLAALAGAETARAEGSAAAGCSRAASVTEANRAYLRECWFRGADIEVTVATPVRWGPGEAIARAAAGPAPFVPP